jgi:2-keto-4-pentenoate hydratase
MTAGMVIITGSVIPTIDIALGERLDFELAGVGATSMTAV